MPSQATEAKAARLVQEGRIHEEPRVRRFEVQGDSGPHGVTVTSNGAICDCLAYGTCSHILAVQALIQRELSFTPDRNATRGNVSELRAYSDRERRAA